MKEVARLLKAVSEDIRLRILLLLTYGELCVCDIMEILSLPQSTISRHLAYLKNAGFIDDRRSGVWTYYRIYEEGDRLRKRLINLLKEELKDLPSTKSDVEALMRYKEKKHRLTGCG